MPKLDERISTLEAKLKALKVRQQRIDARARALASSRARKDDTRRKIPIGATIQVLVDTDKIDHADLEVWLDAHLTATMTGRFFSCRPKRPLLLQSEQ